MVELVVSCLIALVIVSALMLCGIPCWLGVMALCVGVPLARMRTRPGRIGRVALIALLPPILLLLALVTWWVYNLIT